MSTKTVFAIAMLLAPLTAVAQPGVQKPAPRPISAPPAPQPFPPHDSLVKRDEAGHVIPIDGSLEGVAMSRNPMIDDATRDRAADAIKEWTLDVDQLAIDNVDFMEKLDAGYLEKYDPSNPLDARTIQAIMQQLSSAGPLSGRLLQRGAIDQRPAQLTMQMANEYVQAIAAELSGRRAASANPTQTEQQAQQLQNAQEVNRWYQSLSARDVREQYRRILVDSAPLIDKITPALTLAPETQSKTAPKVAAIKAAQAEVDRLVAVRAFLDDVPFDQRRAYLAKAVALGAASDPFHPAPKFPAKK